MKRENEFERGQRQRAERDEEYLALYDAAAAAVNAMPNSEPRSALRAALESHEDRARYARDGVNQWKADQARKAEAETRAAQAIAASVPYTGEPMNCEVDVVRGSRWAQWGRCDKGAKWVVEAREKWKSDSLTLAVCTLHRNQAAKGGGLTKAEPRDRTGRKLNIEKTDA